MFKRKLTFEDYLLIVVNLFPLYAVWFEGWDGRQVFIVYCLESVIIGFVNVLKMAGVTIFIRPKDKWHNYGSHTMQSGWLFVFFFIIHYGFFIFVQTQLFFAVTGIGENVSLINKYAELPQLLGPEGRLLLMIFVAYYTVQTFLRFISSGEYKTISMMRLMFQPYLRIFVQQFIVIAGSMVLVFGGGNIFILIMVVVKIFAEVYINIDGLLLKAEKDQGDPKIN